MLAAHARKQETTYREALENAVRWATDAERCDSAGEFDDRDVRLHFAQVWAQIATAARPVLQPGTVKEEK